MGRPPLDIEGKTFGRLKVLHRVFPNKYKNQANFLCQCACGNLSQVVGSVLVRGGAQSCGCIVKENLTTHGLTRHPLYNTWIAMIDRCHDESSPTHLNYGARGILVCTEWRDKTNGLAQFISDMGERPTGHTIDRIDNNGPYCKDNCRWATPKEQVMKQKKTHILSHNGRTGSVADWSKWTGLGANTIRSRLLTGQTIKSALEPVNRRHRRQSKITYTTGQTALPPSDET